MAEEGEAALPEETLPAKGDAEESPGAEGGAAAEGAGGKTREEEEEGKAHEGADVGPPGETEGADEGAPGEVEGADEGPPGEAEGGAPGEAEGPPGEAEGPPGEAEGPPGEAEALPGEAEGATEAVEVKEEEGAERVPSGESCLDERDNLVPELSFKAGEPQGPPSVQVEVQLSRRISQSLWELERQSSTPVLEPGSSPELLLEHESQEDLEKRLAEEQHQRAELVEQYRQLMLERTQLRHYSGRLQSRLAELLNKAKGKERPRGELEQHISDKEQRYNRYLAILQELRSQQQQEMIWYQQQMDALQEACDEKLGKVDTQWKAYQAAKKEVAVYTMGRRLGGKQAAIRQVDQIQAREESKEKEMTEVRLEHIKLKNRICKLDVSLKAQEELAEGLHLIDFEQLKIENQTYNEKIEERNEELSKLRRKITNTVQVLTQVKEKLQFVEAENQGQKAQLMAVEALVAQKRDILTKTKQVRDRLRIDNEKLHQKCGLLGDRVLLRDYEEKVNVAEVLKERLEVLKHQHAGLALTCEGVKKKIRRIKSFLPI